MDDDVAMLDRALLAAHERRDHDALATLYTKAADISEDQGDVDAACFYLTQALVFALERGSKDAETLNTRLVRHGRSVPFPS